MDSHTNHTPLHWGYSPPAPNQNHWTPPQTRSMKRALSESDCEELYSEESSKDQTSPGETDSCQLLSRKKRRGVIEKKRRDRINSSLLELKRLVPSAFEKQGSAKLEKAEILQLTVDHLKNLHSKGLDSIAFDPQRFAMDYHLTGFRECATEVARYLVSIEGMDIQDPLRLRLMSHLQYFVQQRELSVKSGSSPNWSSSSYQPNYTPPPYQIYPTQSSSNTYVPNLPPPVQPYPVIHPPPLTMNHHTITQSAPTATTSTTSEPSSQISDVSSQQSQAHLRHSQQVLVGQQQQQPQTSQEQQQQQQPQQQQYPSEHEHATYIDLTNSDHRNASTSIGYGNNPQFPPSGAQGYNAPGNYAGNGTKPYRPWGAEMAY